MYAMNTALELETESPLSQVVAMNVRSIAAGQGFSQIALARATGLPQPSVSRRWKGQLPWSIDELGNVARVLGVPLAIFFEEPEYAKPLRWITPKGSAARSKGLEPPTF